MSRPADYRDVVHPRRLSTRIYVVALTSPCIELRDQTARPVGRDHWTLAAGELEAISPPEHWLVAVILCAGDDATAIVSWLKKRRGDPARVVFIIHPSATPVRALKPWYNAGHPDPVVIFASAWKELAKPLGQFVNDWIYADSKGTGWPLL